MNAASFLSELRRRDIQVWAVGGELHCNAKAGVLTPELRAQLRQRKAEILKLLASGQTLASQERAIVPLQANGTRTPIFAVPGHNGEVFCYRALARALGDDQPFFGLQPPGLDGAEEPLLRVESIAGYFAAQIRAHQPQGPYIIAGYCAGGTVAYELAQQLSRGGAEISLVALFGSPYPAWFTRSAQLRERLVQRVEWLARLARDLASRPWGSYFSERLRQRQTRREAEQAAKLDPVLMLRAKVERATVSAVRRYQPRDFAGRVALFLPSTQWTIAQPWRSVAPAGEEYFGPDGCTSAEMLRPPYAGTFAELLDAAIRRESPPPARSG
jgi:thioesterase domain-containing protein